MKQGKSCPDVMAKRVMAAVNYRLKGKGRVSVSYCPYVYLQKATYCVVFYASNKGPEHQQYDTLPTTDQLLGQMILLTGG